MKKPPSAADLRGLARLATEATQNVTRIAEGVHQSVWSTLGMPEGDQPGKTRGITGLVYRSVLDITGAVGWGIDKAISGFESTLQPLLKAIDEAGPESPQRAAMIAALNGVLGDHLEASGNALQLPMTLRVDGQIVMTGDAQGQAIVEDELGAMTGVSGHLVLMLHGLCMNDLQWRSSKSSQSHADRLGAADDCTPVHIRYNSGRHISQNGRLLATLLQSLVDEWPVPVRSLSIIGHSMGGLLARSAFHYAAEAGLSWPSQCKAFVSLGTPHHGSPLERAGNWVDVILGSTRHTAPFAKLGQLRSAGITDLRFGNIRDEDWQDRDRFERSGDTRTAMPLPAGITCYTIAASTAPRPRAISDRIVGDGLVPVASALGQHEEGDRHLEFEPDKQFICYGCHHMQLLYHPEVTEKLLTWLAPLHAGGKALVE
ncbi:hypothetical protein [Allohahella marinimesophila]|uniref:Permease n=1 Tax=Allohahella marinimesophila TaxID=1054972 RepID=A0ABP7NNR1_9GAMM